MKTIAYILPDTNAGVASVIRNLIKYKSKRYFVKVILLHDNLNNPNRRIKDNFLADEIIRIVYNGKWDSAYSVYSKFKRYIDSETVIVSNDGGLDLLAISLFPYKISVCYIMHGNLKHYYNALHEKSCNISSIIAVSDFLYNKIKSKEEVNNTAVFSAKFPVPKVERVQQKACDKSIVNIIFIGTLLKAKGVLWFQEILKKLEVKGIDYKFSIVGSGPEEVKLKKDLSKNFKVSFYGRQENKEVLKLLVNQDVIVLPSESEGLPVVIVEAMKTGVVPITTDLPSGIPELITHGVNGFTVAQNEVCKISDFIEVLYNDRMLLRDMSNRCIEKANEMFDPIKQTSIYEDIIVNSVPKQQTQLHKYKWFNSLPFVVVHQLKNKI